MPVALLAFFIRPSILAKPFPFTRVTLMYSDLWPLWKISRPVTHRQHQGLIKKTRNYLHKVAQVGSGTDVLIGGLDFSGDKMDVAGSRILAIDTHGYRTNDPKADQQIVQHSRGGLVHIPPNCINSLVFALGHHLR